MPNYQSAFSTRHAMAGKVAAGHRDPRLYVSSVTIKSGTLRTLEERESGIS